MSALISRMSGINELYEHLLFLTCSGFSVRYDYAIDQKQGTKYLGEG